MSRFDSRLLLSPSRRRNIAAPLHRPRKKRGPRAFLFAAHSLSIDMPIKTSFGRNDRDERAEGPRLATVALHCQRCRAPTSCRESNWRSLIESPRLRLARLRLDSARLPGREGRAPKAESTAARAASPNCRLMALSFTNYYAARLRRFVARGRQASRRVGSAYSALCFACAAFSSIVQEPGCIERVASGEWRTRSATSELSVAAPLGQ